MDGRNPKGVPKATLRELLAFARPQRATLVLVCVMGIFGTLAALAQPLAVSSVLGAITAGRTVWGPCCRSSRSSPPTPVSRACRATCRGTLSRVSEERTVVVIAHRLSTVVDADRIVVLDEGRVQGIGTHEELLASNPLYRKPTASQFAGRASPRGRV